MTKTKKPFDPTAFNFHSYYTGVILCSLLDIDFNYWHVLPCDFKEADQSVLEWIEHAQERLVRDSEYSPVEGLETSEILEIATRAADQLNFDRGRRTSLETNLPRFAESVH